MGEVYRARDTRLDRTVAIKVLPEALAAEPQFHERFEREARALAALSHSHICQVFDVGREHGLDFLVLEYLEGETLAARLERGMVPVAEALEIGIHTADALAAAHRAGIVHRDLKPGNVMLTRSGVKLLDFGLAKSTAPAVTAPALSMLPTTPPGRAGLTEPGTILGTFQYMAPEQLEGRDADARTDIFAFGAVLYEMLTGRKAFEGKTHASLIGAIMHADPAPVSSVQPLVPRALDRLVRKCLAKDPDERWQSARDLLDELRWVAEPVEPSGAVAATAPAAPTTVGRNRLAWAVAATSLVVAVLAAAAAVYLRTSAPEPPVTRLDVVTPPTSDPFSFALSPDGRQLTYVANGERGSQLWLRRLDEARAQPLAGTEGASFPFWAPDSRAVAFFADGRLKRLNIGAGAPQVLATAPTARGGTWNRDDAIVFGQASPGALMRVPAGGGAPSPVTRLTAVQSNHRWPQFLPDGRRILFFVQGAPSVRGVYVAPLDGGEPTRVMESDVAAIYAPPGYLLRVSQGVLTAQRFDEASAALIGEPIPLAQNVGDDDGLFRSAFTVSESGVVAHRAGVGPIRRLVWIDRAGTLLGTIGEPDENAVAHPELAPDGRRVALTRTVQGNNDIWVTDVERVLATRFTFDATTDARPIWSPDGKRIVFQSLRQGAPNLFEKAAGGEGEEQPLLVTAEAKSPLDWSPDGAGILYATENPKTASDLWIVPLAGDRKPVPVVQSAFDDVQGQISPDGRWLAYASNESGRYEVYIQAFPKSGGKWQASSAGGGQPRWRRDGRELYYLDPDNRLTAVPIQGSTDGRTADVGKPVVLFPTRVAVGANIFQTGYISRAQYDVAADGRFLMVVAADDATASPITVVLNWELALGR